MYRVRVQQDRMKPFATTYQGEIYKDALEKFQADCMVECHIKVELEGWYVDNTAKKAMWKPMRIYGRYR